MISCDSWLQKGEFLKEKGRYESFLGKVSLKTSSKNSIISLGIEGWILSKHWLPSLKKKKSTAKIVVKTTESCRESTRWQPTCLDETEKLKQHVSRNTQKRKSSLIPLFVLEHFLKEQKYTGLQPKFNAWFNDILSQE